MASTIKLKNGSGAPLAADLVQGEPALDLTNKRLYTEDSGGTVIEIGTNPSSLSINGTAVTATAAELNTLDGITATVAELNTLDGITATVTELNYTDGVTSNIQTQLDAKAPTASPTFTGTVTASVVDATYYNEGVYSLTGTAIDPANGSVQYKTLSANTTFTESLADGDSVTLRISGGATYTVTWPTMTWVTSAGNTAPTLTAGDVVVLWQEGTTVYGAYVGSYV